MESLKLHRDTHLNHRVQKNAWDSVEAFLNQAATKALLRKQLRQQRASLTADFCHDATLEITKRLVTHPLIERAQHIAFYWPTTNECSPIELIEKLGEKNCYLPVLSTEHKGMEFYSYVPGETLKPNHFNILEPLTRNKTPIETGMLDIVLLPLLGFDLEGHRLGMGGGYYDQSFAFLKSTSSPSPCLIGLAYEFQKLPHVPHEPWDIDLNYVVTEQSFYEF